MRDINQCTTSIVGSCGAATIGIMTLGIMTIGTTTLGISIEKHKYEEHLAIQFKECYSE